MPRTRPRCCAVQPPHQALHCTTKHSKQGTARTARTATLTVPGWRRSTHSRWPLRRPPKSCYRSCRRWGTAVPRPGPPPSCRWPPQRAGPPSACWQSLAPGSLRVQIALGEPLAEARQRGRRGRDVWAGAPLRRHNRGWCVARTPVRRGSRQGGMHPVHVQQCKRQCRCVQHPRACLFSSHRALWRACFCSSRDALALTKQALHMAACRRRSAAQAPPQANAVQHARHALHAQRAQQAQRALEYPMPPQELEVIMAPSCRHSLMQFMASDT